ncbi:HAAS signaling domain-containing protein [Knoellia sp. CPCC 206450]|uniref:HAAS signaling domain-containing protein n=1 Tax=Knoellia tibetensis TaxID=3404798 RepID=UPI003B42F28E
MTPATTHPLVAAWLRDLDLLLHGVEPGERAEVLAGVHEHLDATLPPGSSDADVRRVLADLGSPQSVADETYAGQLASVVTRLGARAPRRGWLTSRVSSTLRGWPC